MPVHKGGEINNVQLITGVGSAEMSQLLNLLQCQNIQRALWVFYTHTKKNCGCQLRRRVEVGGGGGVSWGFSGGLG